MSNRRKSQRVAIHRRILQLGENPPGSRLRHTKPVRRKLPRSNRCIKLHSVGVHQYWAIASLSDQILAITGSLTSIDREPQARDIAAAKAGIGGSSIQKIDSCLHGESWRQSAMHRQFPPTFVSIWHQFISVRVLFPSLLPTVISPVLFRLLMTLSLLLTMPEMLETTGFLADERCFTALIS